MEHAAGAEVLGVGALPALSQRWCFLRAFAFDLLSGITIGHQLSSSGAGEASVLSSFRAVTDDSSVQDWVFCSCIRSFIICSFSTEHSMLTRFQALYEALKTQE